MFDRLDRSTSRPERARAPFHTPPRGRTRRQRANERNVVQPQPPSVLDVLYANVIAKEDLLQLIDFRMTEITRRDERYVQKTGMLRTLGCYIRNAESPNQRVLKVFRDLIGSIARHNLGVKVFTKRLAKLCDGNIFHDAVVAATEDDFRTGMVARARKRSLKRGDPFLRGEAVLRALYNDPQTATTN